MPRRYGADGTRLWNGKTPEEFTEADAYRFMAETEAVLQRKELMDDPAQPAPASGKEEFYLSKAGDQGLPNRKHLCALCRAGRWKGGCD